MPEIQSFPVIFNCSVTHYYIKFLVCQLYNVKLTNVTYMTVKLEV